MKKEISEEVANAIKILKDFCRMDGDCSDCPFSKDGKHCELKKAPVGYPNLERKIIYELPDDGNL